MIRRLAFIPPRAYHILFKTFRVSCESVLDGKSEEAPEPLRLQKERALQQPLKLCPNLLLGKISSCVRARQGCVFLTTVDSLDHWRVTSRHHSAVQLSFPKDHC